MQLGLYQHYNGNYYHAIGVCRHSETLEEMVVYRRLYADYGLWVRPMAMFQENIMHGGENIPRFKFIRMIDVEPPSLR